jgi:hypothetical protein
MKIALSALILTALLCPAGRAQGKPEEPAGRTQDRLVREIEDLTNLLTMLSQEGKDRSAESLAKEKAVLAEVEASLKQDPRVEIQQAINRIGEVMENYYLPAASVELDEARAKGFLRTISGARERLEKSLDPARLEALRRMGVEKAAVSQLGNLRAALSFYYSDNQESYPKDPQDLVPKYTPGMPKIALPNHPANSSVKILSGIHTEEDLQKAVTDEGGWIYIADPSSPINGRILINCGHTDWTGFKLSEK